MLFQNCAEAVSCRIGQLPSSDGQRPTRVWFRNCAEPVASGIGQLPGSDGQRPTRPSRRPVRPGAQLLGVNRKRPTVDRVMQRSAGLRSAKPCGSETQPRQFRLELASCLAPMTKDQRGHRADLADRWPSSSVSTSAPDARVVPQLGRGSCGSNWAVAGPRWPKTNAVRAPTGQTGGPARRSKPAPPDAPGPQAERR